MGFFVKWNIWHTKNLNKATKSFDRLLFDNFYKPVSVEDVEDVFSLHLNYKKEMHLQF